MGKDEEGVSKLLQLVKNPGKGVPEDVDEDDEDDPEMVAAIEAVLKTAGSFCKEDPFAMQDILAEAERELRGFIRNLVEIDDAG